MKIEDFYPIILTEGLSQIVYHATKLPVALSILTDGAFKLSSVVGKGEESLAKKGRKFFMSVTRTKTGQYHQGWKDGVIFVLDGKAISANYTAGSVDYFASNTNLKRTEAEDRIYSDKSLLPIKNYIQAAHILITPETKTTGKKIVKQCISKNIKYFVYADKNAWLSLDTRKSTKLDLRGRTSVDKQTSNPEITPLTGWVELIQFANISDISEAAKKILAEYGTGKRFIEHDLTSTLRNNGKPTEPYYSDAAKIVEFMAKRKLKTVKDLGDFIISKWKDHITKPETKTKQTGSKFDGDYSTIKVSSIQQIVQFIRANASDGGATADKIEQQLERSYHSMKDFMSEPEFLQSYNMKTMEDVFRTFKLTKA